MVVLGTLVSACVRPPPPLSSLPAAALPPATQSAADVASREEPTEQTAPVTLKPASKPKIATVKASAASSLGGHDRHLVLRPLDRVLAADFELGILMDERTDPDLWTTLKSLEIGLVSEKLPYELFSNNASALARIIYPKERLQGITAVRFAAPRAGTGSTASIGIRIFTRRSTMTSGETSNRSGIGLPVRSSATGLVILVQGTAGSWNVEHFELDLGALAIPMERSDIWDPYSTPVQY